MALTVADIGTWLASLGISVPVDDAYWVPPQPDRMVLVAFTGGHGLVYQRAFDEVYVSLTSRGAQRQPADAKALADEVDTAILGVVPPVSIGTGRVNDIYRTAPPRHVATDKAMRAQYVAVYSLLVARS